MSELGHASQYAILYYGNFASSHFNDTFYRGTTWFFFLNLAHRVEKTELLDIPHTGSVN